MIKIKEDDKCFSPFQLKSIRCGLRFFNKNTQRDTRKNNIQGLQIKNFVESYFVIYCSEYASGVRNLNCQRDSLFQKAACYGFLSAYANVLTKFAQKSSVLGPTAT